MTQEGFDKLQEELHQLRTTGRAEVSEKIRIARGFGDLSENSEYDEAKNDQAVMEARIAQLEEQLKHVEIIDHDDIATDAVSVGSLVKILDVEYGDLREDPDYQLLCEFALEQRTVKELAQSRGITIAACKKRLERARKRLKKYFEGMDGSGHLSVTSERTMKERGS